MPPARGNFDTIYRWHTTILFSYIHGMKTIEKLNEVLFLFKLESEYQGLNRFEIDKRLKEKNIEVSYRLLTEILHKLIKDQYLRTERGKAYLPNPTETDYYLLTLEGEIFQSNGGFLRKLEDEEYERWLNKKLRTTTIDANVSVSAVNKLFWATFAIAIAGALATWLSFINDNEKNSLREQLKKEQDLRKQIQAQPLHAKVDSSNK